MKPKTTKKVEEGQKSTQEAENPDSNNKMWRLLNQIQQDQRDFFKFQKSKHEWEARVYKNLEGSEMPPPFPYHILGEEDEEESKEAEKTTMEKKKGKEPMKAEPMKGSVKKTVSDPSVSTIGVTRKGPRMRFPKKAVDVTPDLEAKKKETVIPKKDQKLKTVKERVEIVLEESSEEEEPEDIAKYYSSEESEESESEEKEEDEQEERTEKNVVETSAVLSPKAAKEKSPAKTPLKEGWTKRKFDNLIRSPRKSNRLRA